MTDQFKPLSRCETGVYYFILCGQRKTENSEHRAVNPPEDGQPLNGERFLLSRSGKWITCPPQEDLNGMKDAAVAFCRRSLLKKHHISESRRENGVSEHKKCGWKMDKGQTET